MFPKSISKEYQLFDIIQNRLALTLDENRRVEVVRAAEELISNRDIRHLEDLITSLSQQPTSHNLWQKFIRIATIGETYFYRDKDQLNALQYTVLKDIIEERRKSGRLQLRLWSAGCSSGEEPYSLGIMLREMLPDINSWNIFILATDLNSNSIERARKALYRSWSFRAETPLFVRQRWFTEQSDGFRLDRSIQQMVTFGQLNLASDDYPSLSNSTVDMDVILCRNVLIYFDNETTAKVISRFHDSLSTNGWMVIGHSESAHMMSQPFEPRNFENAVLHQKRNPATMPVENDIFAPKSSIRFTSGMGTTTNTGSSFGTGTLRPVSKTGALPPLPKTGALPPLPKTGALPPLPLSRSRAQTPAPQPQPQPPARDPNDPVEKAHRAADGEQWKEAMRWLDEAEKTNRLRPEVHYLRGVVHAQLKDADKAIASLRQSIYCDNRFVMAHLALGEVYEKQGNFKKALYQWTQALTMLAFFSEDEAVSLSGDLSVEMLRGLIQFRIDNLPVKH